MAKLAGSYRRNDRITELESLIESNPILAENYHAASAALLSLRSEDAGWAPLNAINGDDGFTLENLHDLSQHAELQVTGQPLLAAGLRLLRNNVFSKGVKFEKASGKGDIAARVTGIMEHPVNYECLHSSDAHARLTRALYTTGNLFIAYNRTTQRFFPIPFDQITNNASDPDIAQDVWYYQRSYTKIDIQTGMPEMTPTVVWYPVLEHFEDAADGRSNVELLTTIGDSKGNNRVDPNIIIIDLKVNTSLGKVWGVPDVLPALPYAWAHSEYIRDASKLLKALSTIAWKVVAKSKGNAQNAAVKSAAPKQMGSTATMTEGTDLVAMPRSGQVDMKDGQTIAAYVASALGVSLVALMSDASAASGSFGAAQTLDKPQADNARERQALWSRFYNRIYRAAGAKDVVANFPKLTEDPIYRAGQTLQAGFASGAIHQNEYRKAFIELTDVEILEPIDSMPEATVFTTAAQYSKEAQEKAEKEAEDEAARAAANPQGVGRSNGIGSSRGNNDLRDMDGGGRNGS